MAHYFGGHTREVGGIHMTVRRAARANMRALQLFTAMPQFYNEKSSIKPERVERFKKAISDTRMDPRFVMVHSAYVINAASPEGDKAARARQALAKEVERSTALGVRGACFHPGSAGAGDMESAIARVADAMTFALESVPGTTRLYIENTAGAGRTVGKTAQEVGAILARIPPSVRGRAGFGLDTCHLFASGHDIHRSAESQRGIFDAFEQAAGEAPSFFHLNDSAGEFASNRDRHALIGDGLIGVAPFRWLLEDTRSEDIPLIFETPHAVEEIAEDDDTPDPADLQMMQLLSTFARS